MTVFLSILRVVTTCTALVMLGSPIPSIIQVLRTKSTGLGSIVPLVALFTNSHFIVLFGYLSEQYFPVFSTFVAGDLMALTYIAIFYRYTHEKAKAHRVFLIFGTAVVLGTVYAFLSGYGVTGQTRHGAGQTMGYCTFATAAVYYSSPMERVGLVLKHRSAAFLNIHMIFAGTLNNLAWVLYSSLVSQWIIFAPNAFCGFMGLVQIALYWIFHPSTHPLVQSETSESTDLERGVSPSPKPTGAEYALVKSPLEPLQHS